MRPKNNKNHFTISIEGTIDSNGNITEENVRNAIKEEEIDEEKIMKNFFSKIEGTSLERVISSFMIGLV